MFGENIATHYKIRGIKIRFKSISWTYRKDNFINLKAPSIGNCVIILYDTHPMRCLVAVIFILYILKDFWEWIIIAIFRNHISVLSTHQKDNKAKRAREFLTSYPDLTLWNDRWLGVAGACGFPCMPSTVPLRCCWWTGDMAQVTEACLASMRCWVEAPSASKK